MAVLKKEELIEKIKSYIGEDTSDQAIELLEDISDSVGVDGISEEEVKRKIEEVEKTWREKYIKRFSGEEDENEDETILLPEEKEKEYIKYDELFEEEKKED